MKHLYLFRIIISIFILLHSITLSAQTSTKYWAKRIFETMSIYNNAGYIQSLTTDKHGNSYAIISRNSNAGIMDIDGHGNADIYARYVLVSWDCDGGFRWMKKFSSTSTQICNSPLDLATDSMEGVYIIGQTTALTANDTGKIYWDTDTTINISNGNKILYLMKYNSLGQMQWVKSTTIPFQNNSKLYNLSVSPTGDIYWFGLLDMGVYNGGAFSINTRKYYAVRYNAVGNWQATIPLGISTPAAANTGFGDMVCRQDPVSGRFYISTSIRQSDGYVAIGNTLLVLPISATGAVATVAAFNSQGYALWVRQANPNRTSYVRNPTISNNGGMIYLAMISDTGTVFCGSITTNVLGYREGINLMALDTAGNMVWSRYAKSGWEVNGTNLGQSSNLLIMTGNYSDTLVWGNKTLGKPMPGTARGYIVRVDAFTGIIIDLDTLASSTTNFNPQIIAIDKNKNLFLGGFFNGFMSFGADTFSSYPAGNNYYSTFIAKYKNANCNCNLPQPAFTFTPGSLNSCKFNYSGSTPYASISWDFGDGSPIVSGGNPQHIYAASGTYPVCVTVKNGCGGNTFCQNVSVNITGVEDIKPLAADAIYPNPVKDRLYISSHGNGERSVTDLVGRILIWEKNDKEYINVEALNPGVYILRVSGKVFKFVKE
ncbi:MAG: T9SS type A sorting domain-containing protein [Bacteroidetes bacterium]|nr:T9SS type A sorting domain-containing protein [Bacteroidota bacterium]